MWLRGSVAVAVLVGFDNSPSESGGSTIFFASRVCSGSGQRLGFLEVPGRCSTPNRPIGGLCQHSEWRDSMTKATAPVASTAQGSRTQRLTGSMAPVHRRAWVKTREDAITDQTSDHGNCRMTRRMTSPRHKELTRPAKKLHSRRIRCIACGTRGER